jgi:hypothetical protein
MRKEKVAVTENIDQERMHSHYIDPSNGCSEIKRDLKRNYTSD